MEDRPAAVGRREPGIGDRAQSIARRIGQRFEDRTFTIQGSQLGADGPWLTLLQTATGHAGIQSLDIPLNRGVRYVRLSGLTRATRYGYSL